MENKTNTYTNIKDSTLSVKEKSKLLEGKDCIFFLIYTLGGVWDIWASREAPKGTDRPTSTGSSVLSSAADSPRVTDVPATGGTCWAGYPKLISHRRELWGLQGCCPSELTPMLSPRPRQVPTHPSSHWIVSTTLRKRLCWAPLPNQDRRVITAGPRSLSF